MDQRLKEILEVLPAKPPRSRLEACHEFIQELRRRGRTYREIASILAEKCELRVTASGIHDFIKRHPGTGKTPAPKGHLVVRSFNSMQRKAATPPKGELTSVQHRIATLKSREVAIQPVAHAFDFDCDEPLRLKKTAEAPSEKRSSDH